MQDGQKKEETHPRFARMLRMIKYMTGNTSITIHDLAKKNRTTCRTIYRYIDTFTNAGFVVKKVRAAVYQLVSMDNHVPDFEQIVYFTEEEACIIRNLIEGLDNTNTLKSNLCRKLACIYSSAKVSDYPGGKSNSYNITELGTAISTRKKVLLHGYSSGHSQTITDRQVEPFAFTNNHIHVWAYDLSDGLCKTFGIARIGEAEVLDSPWEHEAEHKIREVDLFHMPGDNPVRVILELGYRAKCLLLEEFPLAESDIRQEGNRWILDTEVRSMKGVGRFVMGLADDIRIIDSNELKSYIKGFTIEHINSILN